MAIGKPIFCLSVHLTGVHFRDELQHVGDVREQKIKCRSNQELENKWCQAFRRTDSLSEYYGLTK